MKEVKSICRKISKDCWDRGLRQIYYAKRKRLKRLIKENEKKARRELERRLEDLHEKNPEAYWKTLEELDRLTKTPDQEDAASCLDSGTWSEHFNDLLNSEGIEQDSSSINEAMGALREVPVFNELNYSISINEVSWVIKKLKNNKSSGPDSLIYEMIKHGQHILTKPIVRLFNKVLVSGNFPARWSVSMLKPLFKGNGSKFDPTKYRGISLMSCMGKIMCSVLNNRLSKFWEERKTLHKAQIGFKKGCRTTDHIFVLQSIVHKYINKFKSSGAGKKYLYTAFVDFSKAYDTVWREALYYKLITGEVSGNFLDVIMSIYKNYRLQIKLQEGLTEPIKTNVGLKQGCVLSPLLFNFYINDLPSVFSNQECDPITIYNESLNCLMYADDLVLLSTTAEGLQNCLDRLGKYCHKWKLRVNIEKTKILVFNKGGKLLKNQSFKFGSEELEIVKSYKYLGIIFDVSGSTLEPSKNLRERATKAMFKIMKTFGGKIDDCKVGTHLFNHMIKPILTYGSSVWGAHVYDFERLLDDQSDKPNLYFDKIQVEMVQTKFNKMLLGVHRKAANTATYAELGVYPLAVDITLEIVKFWLHVLSSGTDSLVHDCYMYQIQEINSAKCWLSAVKSILIKVGLEQVWYQQQVDNPQNVLKVIKAKVKTIYERQVKNQMAIDRNESEGGGNKLRTYWKCKSTHELEPYLLHVKPLNLRTNISKLRISAHDLNIERGRYHRPQKLPISERKCQFCGNVEDEKHAVIFCIQYTEARKILFDKISTEDDTFLRMNSEDKFIKIMRCGTKLVSEALANFLTTVVNIRGKL